MRTLLSHSFPYFIAALFFLFIAASSVLGWVSPAVAPPEGNVSAPLNITATGQTKSGGLILNTGGAANGLIVDKGKVGIGTTDPGSFLLKVAGAISASSNKISEVAAPVASDDVATKGYVDAQAGGGGVAIIKPYVSPRVLIGSAFCCSARLIGTISPITPGWLMTVRKMSVRASGDSDGSGAKCFARVNYVTPPSLDTPLTEADNIDLTNTYDISAIDSSLLRDAITSIELYGYNQISCTLTILSGYEYQP